MTRMKTGPLWMILQCAEEMEAYRQLTQDRAYGSRAENGRMQLVRVTYDANGAARVEECGPWVPCAQWIDWLREQMI